jgi:hypothetical protein
MQPRSSFTFLAVVIGTSLVAGIVTAQGMKQLKQARKVLEKLKLVDGRGSGLDADTVQGMTPTQLLAEVAPGPTGPPGPAGPPGGGALTVRDANGAYVGTVIGPTYLDDPPCGLEYPSDCSEAGATPVVRKIGSTFIHFYIDGFRLRPGKNLIPRSFSYESTDCSGPAFIGVPGDTMMSMVWAQNDIYYYPVLPTVVMTLGSAAFPITDESPCSAPPLVVLPDGRCCKPGTGEERQRAEVAILDLAALGLVRPFHVEAGP